jgi:DNA-binding beta-propeller fold protein YncE
MKQFWCLALLGIAIIGFHAAADETATGLETGEELPTGKSITPRAARGAIFQDLNPGHPAASDVRAGGAAASDVSPDGKLLAVLTSGYNQFRDRNGKALPELSTEYLFLFDITGPRPRQLQVLPIHATFQGMAWATSDRIFASGGVDDAVVEFVRDGQAFVPGNTIRLEHRRWVGSDIPSFGRKEASEAGGLAVSPDGKRLLVANLLNDSVSLVDVANGRVIAEQDLRPGVIDPRRHGEAGGSYPRAVTWISTSGAYVASERDREVISLAISQGRVRVVRRIPVDGQPAALVANRAGSRLYVALDTTNRVDIFDTRRDRLLESFDVVAPESIYANTQKLGERTPMRSLSRRTSAHFW